MKKLYGVVPPMVTPFKKSGELDVDGLKTLVSFLADKVNGLFICGSYGCGYMMNVEERKKVAETVMDLVGDKISVVVHVGTTNTRDSVELAVHARDIGAQAASAVPPFYVKHKEESVIRHFSELVKAVGDEFPVYVYDNPNVQGFPIDYKYLLKLKAVGVKGVKDASMSIYDHANFMRFCADDDFDVVSGTEAIWLPCAILGCNAFMPGLGNAFPEICTQLFEDCRGPDYNKARETYYWVAKVRDAMYSAPSTQQAVYGMLKLRGILDAHPRLPFLAPNEDELVIMKEKLTEVGVL